MEQIVRWHVSSSPDAAIGHVAELITSHARQAITTRGKFEIVLAGGTTPRDLYQRLRGADTNWQAWHIYFGDERCLPQNDPGRNDVMAHTAWLDRVSIPREQIHSIPAELGANEGAVQYARTIDSIDTFDLVLLGLGTDGHTASLFPGYERKVNQKNLKVIPVYHAPKPVSERISLTAHRLSRARHVFFLVLGVSKAEIVAAWRSGVDLPARTIIPPEGVDVFIDDEAMAKSI